MSRRTRRSTSLAACFQDQYVPSLAQQRHEELKAFLEGHDAELKVLQQCDDAEQLTPCPDEDEELKIPQAPLQCGDDGKKTPKQYQDEQEKKSEQYSGEEQKKPEHYQGEKEKKPEQHTDEEEETSQYQEEVLMTQNQREDVEEAAAERYQDPEQKTPQQHQETDEKASEQSEEDEREEEQKAGQKCCNTEQKVPEQFQGEKKLATPPRAVDNVPRFSLQELIQQKQLQTGDTKHTNKLGGHGESVLPDHKVSGSGGAAVGGTTLAMVIKRPEGGKKSMGMIRRCVKALNQMIKTKHGSKKNLHL
ncbi:hypothetical protein HU200_051716 [Digitaria exilis]|uniref:Uncharacterized protein n=1 Tax=Digitaria exilis TaxID=1010633 RepID=A0A835E6S5_9POAL|nr:hypothetical protein HU200_051716 [Digitaria exilis]